MTRRAILASGLALGGCAVDTPAPNAPKGAPSLLTPWLSLTGGWRLDPQRLPFTGLPGPRVPFVQPVGVAARGDIVMVADAGARTVWRMERSRDAMAPFVPFSGSGVEQGASMQLGSDLSLWLALPGERAVAHYDARGRELRRWRSDIDAARPVAIAVPEDRSELLVADSASARIAVFEPLGAVTRLLDRGRGRALQSVSAMALGPQGLYVLDRIAQHVVVFDPAGDIVEAIGAQQLVQPRALAVDRTGRVFVSDDADQRIKVFRGDRLLAAAGGFGGGPGRFGRIEGLAVDGNLLYVADSAQARVQILLVAPPSMEGAAK